MAEAKNNKELDAAEVATTEQAEVQAPAVESSEEATATKLKPTTKAGKRSEKGIKEAEEKIAKTEAQIHRKEKEAEEAEKPKAPVKPPRSRVERKGKGYRQSFEKIEKGKTYKLSEALDLAIETSHVKFDASIEIHARLGVDPRHADQNIRDTIVLPAGTGKTVRVAVFADADDAVKAKKAGADIADGDEFLQQLDKGTINFDVLIATPAMMPKLGKFARVLGPKGLMPNPKSGTVTTDVAKAVTEAKAGRVEYRVDSTGIVHVGIGKVSFGQDKLGQNAKALFASIKSNKPASVKGSYVKSIFVTSTMGPSIKIDNSELA